MLKAIHNWLDRLNPPREAWLEIGTQRLPLLLVRNPRARRYLLRLQPDGRARVTIPRGGSTAQAGEFARRNIPWLAAQLKRLPAIPPQPQRWVIGSEVLFRGELVLIQAVEASALQVRVGTEIIRTPNSADDLRLVVETHLRRVAAQELPLRVYEYATLHGLSVRRVTVRNQRSRWGSCSRRGAISLNWRLIQTPAFVRDYIILHELMHLRQMNHSARFWREVEGVCPNYRQAEQWLKQHAQLLRTGEPV